MGEFTENLLKLTEFPFSYTLIGLIALISGHGINLEELSFAEVGPLLILMGFVATTLSICDPVGAIQRWVVKGRKLPNFITIDASTYFQIRIFGKGLFEIFPPPYLFAIAFSPSEIKKRYEIDWQPVENFSSEVREFSRKLITRKEFSERRKLLYTRLKSKDSKWSQRIQYIIELILPPDVTIGIGPTLAVDISLADLIRARMAGGRVSEGFKKFMHTFESYGKELIKINQYDVQDIREMFEGLKKQTVKTKWITTEVDRITALFYFIIIISLFLVATQIVYGFLPKFEHAFGNIKSADVYITIFSIFALIAVCIMLVSRIIGLQSKALIVFKYLTVLRAIKTHKEDFKTTLEEIERYLDDNHWTLAEYWVNRVQQDYSEVYLKEVKRSPSVTW